MQANHRDFLGACLGTGLERSKVGDIIVQVRLCVRATMSAYCWLPGIRLTFFAMPLDGRHFDALSKPMQGETGAQIMVVPPLVPFLEGALTQVCRLSAYDRPWVVRPAGAA